MGFLEVFKISLAAGFGLSIGYYISNIATSLAIAKLQTILIKRKYNTQPGKAADKKCMKCKKNARPDNGLYCTSCQFDGGHKF
jgi:hypothetical protein